MCFFFSFPLCVFRRHVYISNNTPGAGTLSSRDAYKYGTTGVPKPTGDQSGQMIYNGEGLPYRPFDPNDHEYLKTIERQRLMLIGQHPQQHFATLNPFQWPERTETEHIYELPKFETDSHQGVVTGSKTGSGSDNGGRGSRGLASGPTPPPPPPPAVLPSGMQIQNFEMDPRFAGNVPNNVTSGSGNSASKDNSRNMNNRSV